MAVTFDGISVILCCYNSADRLPKTLAYLAAQAVGSSTQWELVIINNNSTDTTTDVAVAQWEKLGAPVSLQIVDEPNPGLSSARDKGMSVAQYELILFCDDDNWLRPDYVDTVLKTYNEYPGLGALGGWSEPVFVGEKPEWFDRFSGNFAVGKPVPTSGILQQPNDYIYGAGMAMPKYVIQRLKDKGFQQMLSDRKGTSLSSGGDVELVYVIKLIGFPVMFNENLFFYHYMPKTRLTWDYLTRLRQSMHWANFVLGIYTDTLKHQPLNMIWLLKKSLKSVQYIYTQNKRLKQMDAQNSLFLKNKIALRALFLKHPMFYYKTRLALKKLQNA